MTFLVKAFSNKRLVLIALAVSILAVFTAFMTAPHDSDPDWIQTMCIVVFSVVATFALGMAEADFSRIARAALAADAVQPQAQASARTREMLANAERQVQRLREQGWTRSDFGHALADTVGEERPIAREAA